MIKAKDTLYLFVISSLEELISEQLIEQIENNIEDSKQNLLLSSMQSIQELINTIELVYISDGGYFEDYSNIIDVLNDSKEIYEPYINLNRIILFCQYAKSVNKFDLDFDTLQIDETKFVTYSDIDIYGYDKCYFYENNEKLENSIIFFNIVSSPIFDSESSFLFFVLLHFLSKEGFEYKNNFIVVKDEEDVTKSKSEAYLKLHLLTSGHHYHEVKTASERNNISIKNKLEPRHTLQQFDDNLIILSEYNSRKEILNKFISIYQIIENFMFKYPLVKLNANNNGEMFSIRSFKDMYDRVSDNEITSLQNFLKSTYDDSFESGELLSHLTNSFHSLITEEAGIDNALNSLGINNKNGTPITYNYLNNLTSNQKKAEWPRIFSKIIYFTRNAIVHNKETEFHLSHNYLDDSIYMFVDKFLLPECENLIYSLIYKPNNLVWYIHDSVRLYDNS
ncbi:hypothetical protein CWN88_16390 [Vibrio splendidus]|uniref:hypothetical protein n=1 Tax=Vibrio splendidus TaxID=29497 RepID=UPI000D348589|nr:hypothetical protein [Vibrio splendidus]PTO99949.1 hypothetical protein CWN88_16390 [Vibrio splendidus]